MTLLRATRPLARRRGRAFAAAALAIGLGLLVPRAVPAHEGHVHEEEKVAPVQAVTGSPRSATSGRHELLVRTEEAAPGTPGRVHLLLADLETNAPVEGATVEITVTGSDSSWTASAIAPGIYETRLPDGGRALDILVRRGEELDLLAIESIQVADASMAAAGALAGRKRPGGALWIALLAAAIAISGSIAAARLRKRRAAALVLVAGLGLAALTSSVSRAHEGELHGAEDEPHAEGTPAQRMAGPGIVPPGARYVAKEAQFEIGLRTAMVREEALAPVRTAYGTVVADPGATARLVAPQTGRFVSSRTWRLGDRMTRGQLFGSRLLPSSTSCPCARRWRARSRRSRPSGARPSPRGRCWRRSSTHHGADRGAALRRGARRRTARPRRQRPPAGAARAQASLLHRGPRARRIGRGTGGSTVVSRRRTPRACCVPA